MSQTDLEVRRVAFKIVEKWEFDDEGHEYDQEVLAEGKRYLQRKDESLRKGWIRRKQLKTIEIDKPDLLSWLKDAVNHVLARYPNGRLTRAASGVIKLHYQGFVWRRGGFNNYGTPCAGPLWSRLVIGDGTKDWRREAKEYWGTLNQKVSELENAQPDDVPRPSPDTPAQREPLKRKNPKRPEFAERNKHTGLIIHSLANSGYYIRLDIGKSKKYPRGFTLLICYPYMVSGGSNAGNPAS